jgi:hypothetical protein
MNFKILDKIDTTYLDVDLLDEHKHLIVKPAAFYNDIPQDHLSLWCHIHGVYCLPTVELINWLSDHLEVNKTIEIGAGIGSIGRTLGIPITDSCYMRNNPQVAMTYKLMRQPVTPYPEDIVEMDAISAIKHYKPNIVIGSWITHKYNPAEHWREGNEFGVDEKFILNNVKKYIMIGNEAVHSKKPILELPHQAFRFDWLYSRSTAIPKADIIYIWQPKKELV